MNHMSPLTQPILCLRSCDGSDIIHRFKCSQRERDRDTEGRVLRAGAGDAERRASEPEQIFLKETAHELSLKGWLDFYQVKEGELFQAARIAHVKIHRFETA